MFVEPKLPPTVEMCNTIVACRSNVSPSLHGKLENPMVSRSSSHVIEVVLAVPGRRVSLSLVTFSLSACHPPHAAALSFARECTKQTHDAQFSSSVRVFEHSLPLALSSARLPPPLFERASPSCPTPRTHTAWLVIWWKTSQTSLLLLLAVAANYGIVDDFASTMHVEV